MEEVLQRQDVALTDVLTGWEAAGDGARSMSCSCWRTPTTARSGSLIASTDPCGGERRRPVPADGLGDRERRRP
ncbi:hypothetical protein NKH18_42495 [Streptomyces sp. M10(2022)]